MDNCAITTYHYCCISICNSNDYKNEKRHDKRSNNISIYSSNTNQKSMISKVSYEPIRKFYYIDLDWSIVGEMLSSNGSLNNVLNKFEWNLKKTTFTSIRWTPIPVMGTVRFVKNTNRSHH